MAQPESTRTPRPAKNPKAKKDDGPPPLAPLSKFQNGRTVVMNRRDLQKASYNPRTITPEARKRLKAEIEQHGYLDRVVANQRTGLTIVRGHQRLACLDALHGGKDYSLEITLVDEDEQWERAANISGNASTLHGDWDTALLEEMYTKWNIKPEATGFTRQELSNWFGISPAQQDMADLDKKVAAIDEFKSSNDKVIAEDDAANDHNFFVVLKLCDDDGTEQTALLVFPSKDARKAMLEAMGLSDGRYLDARSIRLQVTAIEEDPAEWLGEEEDAVSSENQAP